LEALSKARKQVEYLEAALAHNAAFLGAGVEREDAGLYTEAGPDALPDALPEALLRYLGLVGFEKDISDYIGREGDAETRPRLGPDAPDSVRPMTGPRLGKFVGQLAMQHPDEGIILPGAAPMAAEAGGKAVPAAPAQRSLDTLAAEDEELAATLSRIAASRPPLP
ncbi:MAG: hypothetical protein LBH65_02655, partial [Desulfovibrio sp.]|jgi:hypothetical protein|nr:hypothetical protein [Desulfovibrio sp.]